ncbi:MAG: hypothetical protein DRQ13_02375 [Ignavibacteriae bacterium]|nr:MAG: hypothetical protein DRQ13_02375 [Ignavibacteriota bacterium]
MRRFRFTFVVLILFSTLNSPLIAQVFNIEDYIEFLQQHQNMTTEELLQMHPAGVFVDKININPDTVLYFDSIKTKYNLTEYEKSLISDHGFVVTERLAKGSFGEILLDIHHNDLPVFVSTDAILYAFHASYDRILRDVELGFLIDKVSTLLTTLRSQMSQLAAQYNSQPQMSQMLRDVDVYLTVGAKLIGQNTSPYYPENTDKINHLIDKVITAEGFETDTIFSSTCISYDWSQFKPRGHYDSDMFPELREYFRTMMWLGRIEIYLIAPPLGDPFCFEQTFEDVQRQCIDAMLISELFDLASAVPKYEEIEDVIKFFVGDQDNVTLPNMYYLRDAVGITSAANLLDSLTLVEFQDTLANQSFAYQLIQSQILAGTLSATDSIVPASSFLLFGQRYVDDSYVTAQVVYDRIKFNGLNICRLFPSTLDPMFALGNNAAAQLLISELNQYHYATNLAALRYLFDAYSPEYWNSTFYRQWLNAIRTMNPPEDRSELPQFMTTAAFWQEKLNTQLSSWTELRHDNLLYAKQSYTGVPVCSYPYSYVEPFPELYQVMIDIGYAGYNYFQGFNIDPTIKLTILEYFSSLQSISDTLRIISEKELSNTPLTFEETSFLKNMIFEIQNYGGGTDYDGWYPKLIYNDLAFEYENLMGKDYIVADIHTTPSDCGGGMMGWIKHVGTGPVDVGVFIAKIPGGEDCAFIGPVLSYHDYTTEDWLRLTDDEWASTYIQAATRPDWVNIYLADSLGQSRGSGGVLITSVNNDENPVIPQTEILLGNYPNPFNPTTIIAFTIPYDLTNSLTELKIYDLQGRLIKTLVNEVLPAGNYLSKWDGKNDNGNLVASGVYIYNLKVAYKQKSGKMTFLK